MKRQQRKKQKTNLQSTKFGLIPNKIRSEIELLPACVNAWNDSTVLPCAPQTEYLNEPAFIATLEIGFSMFSETLMNLVMV